MDKTPLKKLLPYILLFAVSTIYFSFFLNKGITLYDEGFITESSYLVYLGKIPYKDFAFPYTPLSIWLGSIVFHVFGVGILKLRLIALAVSALTVSLTYWLALRVSTRSVAILTSIVVMVWTFPQTNFLWPSSLVLLPFLLTLAFLIKSLGEKPSINLFLTGVFVTLTALAKQNIGAALFGGILLALLYLHSTKKKFLNAPPFVYGVASLAFVSLAILTIENPGLVGTRETFYRSVNAVSGKILLSGYTSIPLSLNLKENIKSIAKLLFYFSPAFLLLVIFYSKIKGVKIKPRVLGVLLLTFIFAVTIAWPTTDLVHFTFAVPVIALGFAAAYSLANKYIKLASTFFIMMFVAVGIYKTFFMGYYAFEAPYPKFKDTTYIRGEQILVDQKHQTIINGLNAYSQGVLKDKSVFVYSYAPMIYFILDKEPPVYDLYTQENLISGKSIDQDVDQLKKSNPDFVLVEKWRWADSEISRYIKDNYKVVSTIWDFDLWKRIN